MSIYWERVKAERRADKIKMFLMFGGIGLMAIGGMWIIWNIAKYDFCPLYFNGLKCLP